MKTYSFYKSGREILVLSLSLLIFLGLNSCKRNNFSVDLEKPLTAPTAAEFVPNDGKLRIDYYVRSDDAGIKIPIGITNVTSQDRDIKLVYTARSAAPGTQFEAPSSVTIKGGKAVDTVLFKGLFSGYPSGRKDTVKIKFADTKGVYLKDSFELILQRYCNVVLGSLTGDYNNTKEYSSSGAFSYGPYITAVKNLVSTGTNKAEGFIENIYDDGWNDIKVQIDWSNPAAFTLTIPLQATGKADLSVRSTSGKPSSFSSCDQKFILYIDLVKTSTGAVSTTGYQIVLSR